MTIKDPQESGSVRGEERENEKTVFWMCLFYLESAASTWEVWKASGTCEMDTENRVASHHAQKIIQHK